ncbi:MAG: hypothetical protein M3430_19920 [Acidobacteriota bacterium]|nr:hypothetical protein [Acidobacteriota bacterium]
MMAAGRSEENTPELEQTVAAPRFDDETIRRARPATPFSRLSQKTTSPFVVVAACLAAGIIVGVLAGLAALKYYNKSPSAAVNASDNRPENVADDARSQPTPPQTAIVAAAEKTPAATKTTKNDSRQIANESSRPNRERGTIENSKDEKSKDSTREKREAVSAPETARPTGATHDSLRDALDEWVAATNARDLKKQMAFYGGKVDAFYLSRNASRDSVRQEKARTIGRAEKISIRAGSPDIKLSPDGRTATMLFRKQYAIKRDGQERRGAVLQELRWQQVGQDWKIVSERDIRVLN